MVDQTLSTGGPYPRIFGPYLLVSALNEPFVGSLHLARARDGMRDRLLVLKILGPRLTGAGDIARFRAEASAIARLSHRNLVAVLDGGLVGDEAFLVVERVEGRDLRAIWNRCAKHRIAFPIELAVHVMEQVCRGLAHAHETPELGLVHRNVTPPKILISYSGEIKLGDFSLALSAPVLERTEPEVVYGKVPYLSPEQARAEPLDGRSDLYSAGIVLWEMLTGRQLFPSSKRSPTRDLLVRTLNPEPTRPSQRAPRVPVALDEICLKALAADKRDRYAGCTELAQALQTWLAHHAPAVGDTQVASLMRQLFPEAAPRDRT
jgi:serine/threonine protein kinase